MTSTEPSSDEAANASIDAQTSGIQGALDLVGDRWSMLILRASFRGVRRFSAIQTDLGIAKNLLADRLARLVDADILARVPYQDRPVRHEYVLTEKGRDLSAVLIALMHWGDRWCHHGSAPTVLVHDECGEPIEHSVRCPACATDLSPGQIQSRPGRRAGRERTKP